MSQPALDDVQRNALPGHLDSAGVAQLVWGESPPYAGLGRGASKRNSHCEPDQGRSEVGPLITQNGGPTGNETRASSQGRS